MICYQKVLYVYGLTCVAHLVSEEISPPTGTTRLPIPTITPGPNSCETFKSLFGLTYKQMRAKNITYNMLKIDHVTEENVQVDLADLNTILENIKRAKDIVLLIHGFLESSKGAMVQTIAREYRKKGGVAIFAVDGRNAIGIEYFVSTTYARFLGEELGWFLSGIVRYGVSSTKISLVGHSLGAHIAGVAGHIVQQNTGQKLGRITGLDPARPCFTNIHTEGRLDPSDAGFVDVIHTNIGVLGLTQPVGHLDFYPNGGSAQPGCVLTACHHSRAWEVFAESIMSPDHFPGRKCENWTTFKNGDCRNNKVAYMGARSRSAGPGRYYLSTAESPPFGLGASGSGNTMRTYYALTQFPCDEGVFSYEDHILHNPYIRQTVLGCKVLQILQNMYSFNLTYVLASSNDSINQTGDKWYQSVIAPIDDTIDIYVKPLPISKYILDAAFPIQPIFNWRVGFILRDDHKFTVQRFYSLPFTRLVWSCIFLMVAVGSSLFYLISSWERRLLGNRECSFMYEIFIAVSAVCQHILPLQAILCSRRIAYLSFILGTYIIHCFYTSNLLSRLVSDRDGLMNLEELANSDFKIALLKDMNLVAQHKLTEIPLDKNLSIIFNKIQHTKLMEVRPALDAVIYGKTALITDFVTLYPLFKNLYPPHEICDLIEIDIYSNIQHCLITSKKFLLIEEFRIGILRLRENGLLQVMLESPFTPLACHEENIYRRIELKQMAGPALLLLVSFVLALAILMLEKIHYERNRVWPFVN